MVLRAVVDRGQSLVRVLLQAVAQELTDLRGGLRRKQAPVGLAFQHRGDGFLHGVGAKGAFTCEQFVEEASEGPDVRSRIDLFAARLLRAHVGRRADHVARHGSGGGDVLRLGRSLVLLPIDRLRQTEVQDLHLAFRCDHHVRGLEVAVDNASCVSGCESLCDLLADSQRLGNWQRPRRMLAFDQLQNQEIGPVEFLQSVNRGDMRVIQRRQRPCLAAQTRHSLAIACELVGQRLDRDVAAESDVVCPVDLPHTARAEGRDDLVGTDAKSRGQDSVRRRGIHRRRVGSERIGKHGLTGDGQVIEEAGVRGVRR